MKKIPNIPFKSKDGKSKVEFLNLTELFARIKADPNHDPKKPHRIKFNALLIVTKGKGYHQVDLKEYSIEKGDVIKIAKGQVHAFQGDLIYEGVLIVFSEDFSLQYFSQSARDIISHFYNYHISNPLVKNSSFNTAFLKDVSNEQKNDWSITQENIIAKLLELYLLRLERSVQDKVNYKMQMRYYGLFVQFQKFVDEKHAETRNVKDYADLMKISPKHLNVVVKSITLDTAKSFIDQFIVLEIKRKMQSSSDSLKEIAFDLGFDEVTNFSKYFKKHMDMSPKEYKSGI